MTETTQHQNNELSLQVFFGEHLVFQSNGKWLYPLFELEDHLKSHPIDMTQAFVHDKIIGKAAAILLVRLNTGRVHGDLVSDLAINYMEKSGLPFSFDKRVDRIQCKTERELRSIDDPEIAYQILCKRAQRC